MILFLQFSSEKLFSQIASESLSSKAASEALGDPRMLKLAETIVNYSCELKPGQKILIDTDEDAAPLVQAIVKEAFRVGGYPFVKISNAEIDREIVMQCATDQLKLMAEFDLLQMKAMDAVVLLHASRNPMEESDIPNEKTQMFENIYYHAVTTERLKKNWVRVKFPNYASAQFANMSTEGYRNFFYKVCNLDYAKMGEAMKPLAELMRKTDKIRIIASDTDLTLSIKNQKVIPCRGKGNIPDGEVFTTPVKDSANGFITFNAVSPYGGTLFDRVRLEFEKGKIVRATSNDTAKLNSILDTDLGSRFLGEFALGVNPYIEKPVKSILFDEKISGSLHLAIGNAYSDSKESNKSSIHWDIILIQTSECGGGEVWFDDVLIRKDGKFVLPELSNLNPENLK
ncbi:MAG: aminopeptidase [Candidatus Riflebacteria bacterium]|nr:aminopeptidase [Candidatus Riflebacteria bacterium]